MLEECLQNSAQMHNNVIIDVTPAMIMFVLFGYVV